MYISLYFTARATKRTNKGDTKIVLQVFYGIQDQIGLKEELLLKT